MKHDATMGSADSCNFVPQQWAAVVTILQGFYESLSQDQNNNNLLRLFVPSSLKSVKRVKLVRVRNKVWVQDTFLSTLPNRDALADFHDSLVKIFTDMNWFAWVLI